MIGKFRFYRHCLSRVLGIKLGVLLVLFPAVMHGQMLVIESLSSNNKITIGLGWDPVWVQETIYSRKLDRFFRLSYTEFNLGLTVPILALAKPNFKISSGLNTVVAIQNKFGVGLGVNGGVVMSEDFTGNKISLVTQFTLQPGYFNHAWSVALDFAWRTAVATYMRQSNTIQDLFNDRYPGEINSNDKPEDQWYRITANRFHFGLAGRLRVANYWSLFATGGFDYTPQAQGIISHPALGQLPFYVCIGGDYRW